jgi:hypothetical protein
VDALIAYTAVRDSRTTKIGRSDFGPGDGSAFAMRCPDAEPFRIASGRKSWSVFRRPILTPPAFEDNVLKDLGNSRFEANSTGIQF